MMMHFARVRNSGFKVGILHLTLYASFTIGNVTNTKHYFQIIGGMFYPISESIIAEIHFMICVKRTCIAL